MPEVKISEISGLSKDLLRERGSDGTARSKPPCLKSTGMDYTSNSLDADAKARTVRTSRDASPLHAGFKRSLISTVQSTQASQSSHLGKKSSNSTFV